MMRHVLALTALVPLLTAATPPMVASEDLGMLFRAVHPRVLGMDGAFSLSTGPGTAIWSFGDTLVGQWKADGDRQIEAMPYNTVLTVENKDLLTGGSRAMFVTGLTPALPPAELPKQRVWPLDLVAAKQRWWHFYVAIAPTGTGALDFKVVGTGVASSKPVPAVKFEAPKTLWPGEAPSFGASVLASGEWLYMYAGGASTHLARVKPDQLDDPAAYSYWAGARGWRPDWHEAVALPGSGPEVSVRWNSYLKAFVMVYVPPFGKAVVARFAPAPEGPWSEPTHLADCQPTGDATAMFYGAKQHAEMDVEGGRRIFVTYNTNAPSDQIASRPDLYYPHLVRVTFTQPPR